MDKNAFLIDLAEGERTDFGRIAFDEQPEAQKVFSAIWELEGQVNNGGFDQYFRFSESAMIAFAPVALRTIGACSCGAIVERAIGSIAPLPPTQEGRYAALDASGEVGQGRLSSLDDEFFAYPDDLAGLLFNYVSKHPDEFGPAPCNESA